MVENECELAWLSIVLGHPSVTSVASNSSRCSETYLCFVDVWPLDFEILFYSLRFWACEKKMNVSFQL
jgi:hypothetical protein